jgi:hypothetical protein
MKIGVKTATSCVHKTFFALKCEEKCCSPCGYFSVKKGITLIALIITIIIMLILAAVTITIAMNGGLFQQAQNAVIATDIAQTREQAQEIIIGLQLENIKDELTAEDINEKFVDNKLDDKLIASGIGRKNSYKREKSAQDMQKWKQ